MADKEKIFENLPYCATDYIRLVIRKMGYRKKARMEVAEELIDHFEQALKDCIDDSAKEKRALELIKEFGEAKLLAVLMRRAKKRCRPLWQKVLIRTALTLLVIVIYLVLCSSRFFIGSPAIRVNYAQWLTDQVKQGRDESLNANAEVEKAISLLSKGDFGRDLNWPGDMNETEKAAAAKLLQANSEALDMLSKAMQKPYCWPDYNSDFNIPPGFKSFPVLSTFIMSKRLPVLSEYRKLAYSMCRRILLNAYQGNIEQAIQNDLTLFNFAHSMQGQGLLVEKLVGIAIEQRAHLTTNTMVSRAQISAEQLKQLQDALQKNFAEHKKIFEFTGEKAFWYDEVQKGFTDDGKGNGRVLKRGIMFVVDDWKDAIWKFVSFSYPSRAAHLASVEAYFDHTQRLYEMTPWEITSRPTKQNQDTLIPSSMLFKILVQAFDGINLQSWRLRTQREALLTTLALLRFQKETGRCPEKLEELVQAGYLTELPIDPFGNGSLTYKKTADGFLLYSWGSNLKDDGGEVSRNEKGYIQRFAEEGDWVFWPVEKN